MAGKRKSGHPWYLAIVAASILAITAVLNALVPYGTWLDFVVRSTALFAYMTIFLSIVSSNYMAHMVRLFGGPFVRVHHLATITALALLVLHPLGVAWYSSSLSVFVPATDSWYSFFLYAGRPAWYLLAVAAIAAALRKVLPASWRPLHWLNYLAFLLATVHGILLGISFQFLVVKIVAGLMALIVIVIFVLKRRPKPKRPVRQPT